jgi:hypothetical protein
MKRTLRTILIFGFVLGLGVVLTGKTALAQPTKTTDQTEYFVGDPVDIQIEIPGGTDLYVQPTNVVILLDRSNSMYGNPMSGADPTLRIDAAISAINKFLDVAQAVGGGNRPRVALATFGTLGYWERNFTTNYNVIRNELPTIRQEMANTAAGPWRDWECTSHGEGVKLAIDRLVADADPDPGYVIVLGDGAENGKHRDVAAGEADYPPFNTTSRFLEETNAMSRAQNNNIKIHSVGLSNDVTQDLRGVFVGFKCGKIYGNPPFDGYAWRSGEAHLRDNISTPSGGDYKRVTATAGLNGIEAYFEDLFNQMAVDYQIRLYERFEHRYFEPVRSAAPWGTGMRQVELLGNGCSGASDDIAKSMVPVTIAGVPTRYYYFQVKYNAIPQGETRCAVIHTRIKGNAPTSPPDRPVDFGNADDWYYVEIINRNHKVRINQWHITILPGNYLKTYNGNVGSRSGIQMRIPVPTTARVGPENLTNASYLVASAGSIVNFSSFRGWLVPDYFTATGGPDLHGPVYSAAENRGRGGYDYYEFFHNEAEKRGTIRNWQNDNQWPDCTDPHGCFYEYRRDSAGTPSVTIQNPTPGAGTSPIVIFVRGHLHVQNRSITPMGTRPDGTNVTRSIIWVVGQEIKSNVASGGVLTWVCNLLGEDCKQARETAMWGLFITNWEFHTLNSEGFTTIHGGAIANRFDIEGGRGMREISSYVPSEYFQYDPAILWVFRHLYGSSQTSFREAAP